MIALSVAIICATGLIAQFRHQGHQRDMQAEGSLLHKVEARVSALERMQASKYDHAAFEDLKSKVEAMRIAQGMRRG